MFLCASCQQCGIKFWSKYLSGSASPCCCEYCGQLSYIHSSRRFGWRAIARYSFHLLNLVTTGYLAHRLNRAYPLLLLPMAWFLIEFIYLKHTPMRVTDTTQIQQAKRDGNLLLLAALLLLLLFYFSL